MPLCLIYNCFVADTARFCIMIVMALSEDIKRKALEFGFDLVGITDACPIDAEQINLFKDWLAAECAGQMSYMHRNFEKRINPAELLKAAQSVICVGLNYKPPKTHLDLLNSSAPAGRVANYAQYEDYHSFIKRQLTKLAEFITSLVGTDFKYKICVDSAPVAERALAARAGLGFIGKNHMLINPVLGPQIFLGEIITTLKLPTDEPVKSHCPDCNKCVTACPTGALRPDGFLDANKCISYLTIEYKSRIPPDLAKMIGDRLLGCDECALSCPYQQNAPVCRNNQFKFYRDRVKLNLQWLLNLTPQSFQAEFADSPIKRLGLERLKRNAQICLKNLKPPKA